MERVTLGMLCQKTKEVTKVDGPCQWHQTWNFLTWTHQVSAPTCMDAFSTQGSKMSSAYHILTHFMSFNCQAMGHGLISIGSTGLNHTIDAYLWVSRNHVKPCLDGTWHTTCSSIKYPGCPDWCWTNANPSDHNMKNTSNHDQYDIKTPTYLNLSSTGKEL